MRINIQDLRTTLFQDFKLMVVWILMPVFNQRGFYFQSDCFPTICGYNGRQTI